MVRTTVDFIHMEDIMVDILHMDMDTTMDRIELKINMLLFFIVIMFWDKITKISLNSKSCDTIKNVFSLIINLWISK